MKERAILFSSEMIRAILEGRKTQTRRIIKPQPTGWTPLQSVDPTLWGWCIAGDQDWGEMIRCPYAPGDSLYVRETWRIMSMTEDPIQFQYKADMAVDEECDYEDCGWSWQRYERWYERQAQKVQEDCDAAGLPNDEQAEEYNWTIETCPTRWQRSIHMPKFAARIWLKVISVRAERLQEITPLTWVWVVSFKKLD